MLITKGLSPLLSLAAVEEAAAPYLIGDRPLTEPQAMATAAAELVSTHPDYGLLAGRILQEELISQCPRSFSEAMELLGDAMSDAFLRQVRKHRIFLNQLCTKHYFLPHLDYVSMRMLAGSYLMKTSGHDERIVETPTYMLMRVAAALFLCPEDKPDLDGLKAYFQALTGRVCMSATPTLTNAGRARCGQLASCFLAEMPDDLRGMYRKVAELACISGKSGGIGISLTRVRSKGSHIKSSNGQSQGVLPLMGVLERVAKHVDQGGGKRKGATAVYMEPWHADIRDFLDARREAASVNSTPDLFTAVWMNDLLMERAVADLSWTLFDPKQCPDLCDAYGDDFRRRYEEHEREGHGVDTIAARSLMEMMVISMVETGTPYVVMKDRVNICSNEKNMGTICCSNLCSEIVERCTPDSTAVCNLASLCLSTFVRHPHTDNASYDFDALHDATRIVVRALNRVIDNNDYPDDLCRSNNMASRPIGVGVQGWQQALHRMRLAWDDEETLALNSRVFETIYHAALTESCALAQIYGPFPNYDKNGGCPVSRGVLHHDYYPEAQETRSDWTHLRQQIARFGVRNSLLVALMPTASTSRINGTQTETMQPMADLRLKVTNGAGHFMVVNSEFVRELEMLGVWDKGMAARLNGNPGVLQTLTDLPEWIRRVYRTVWELSIKEQVAQHSGRSPWIDQSSSNNMFVRREQDVWKYLMQMWRGGVKTLSYYTRLMPVEFGIDPARVLAAAPAPPPKRPACDPECDSCSA